MKVNSMNLETARDVIIVSSIFAVLPQDFTSKIAIFTLLFGGLYFLNGKLPKDV